MTKSASVNKLMSIKDVDYKTALAVRAVWSASLCKIDSEQDRQLFCAQVHTALSNKKGKLKLVDSRLWQKIVDRVNAIHGRNFRTRSIRHYKREIIDRLIDTHGIEYLGVARNSGAHVYYCNTGDTYAPTIAFNGSIMRVTTFGDMVENQYITEHNVNDY